MEETHKEGFYRIGSRNSLLSLHLGEVWRYRDLLQMLVRRDFITFYKQTILGPLWFVVQPLLTTLIYVVLFGNIAKISTDGAQQFRRDNQIGHMVFALNHVKPEYSRYGYQYGYGYYNRPARQSLLRKLFHRRNSI